MPRRPPKKWMRRCVAGASKSAVDPGAVCGALWYRKMSPSQKRAALAREEKDNPVWASGKHYFRLVRSKRNVYHPGFVGTLDEAVAEARRRAAADRAGVSVVYYPPGEPLAAARTVARVRWSKKQGEVLDNPAWTKVFG